MWSELVTHEFIFDRVERVVRFSLRFLFFLHSFNNDTPFLCHHQLRWLC